MALNTLFPRQKELVNYDYFDIAEGVGITVYYGVAGDNGEYFVTPSSTIGSEALVTQINSATLTSDPVKRFDLDFDLTFNRPKNIKGSIFANIPLGVHTQNSTAKTINYYTIVKAIHFDGSTETIMATGQSKTVLTANLSSGAHQYDSELLLCHCDVTAKQHFKIGDILRFTVEGWFEYATGSGTLFLYMGHDPLNRRYMAGFYGGAGNDDIQFANETLADGTVTAQRTQMVFHVPFQLDV